MSVELLLQCSSCGVAVLAGDEFCEACGAAIVAPGDAARHHLEVDLATVAAVTDRGLVHDRNDDAFHVEVVAGRGAPDGAVVVVCDGVSASTAPDVAAQVAASIAGGHAADGLRQRDQGVGPAAEAPWDAAALVTHAVAEAAAAVAAIPWLESRDREAPACTIVLAVWDGVDVTVGWIGDSRAYWANDAGCLPLTVDHSWAEEEVASGRRSREEAEADGRAHAITRWLGADAPDQPCPVRTFRPTRPGRLLVCTDGLWNCTPEPGDLARRLAADDAPTPLSVARALVRHALARGGHDNVTVAVTQLAPPPNGAPEGP